MARGPSWAFAELNGGRKKTLLGKSWFPQKVGFDERERVARPALQRAAKQLGVRRGLGRPYFPASCERVPRRAQQGPAKNPRRPTLTGSLGPQDLSGGSPPDPPKHANGPRLGVLITLGH